MKNYDEMTTSVLKRVNENNIARKRRRTVVLRTAIPVCGVLAVAGAVALTQIKSPVPTDSDYVAAGGGSGYDKGGSTQVPSPGGNTIGSTIDEHGNVSYIYENTETSEPADVEKSDYTSDNSATDNPKSDYDNRKFFSAPEDLIMGCPSYANNRTELSPEEAVKYYGVDIFAPKEFFKDCTAKADTFTLRKRDGKLVYDGNFVEFEFAESSEYILALFRKETKWVPSNVYESEDFGDTEVIFFKDGAETRAVFEVNGTQITLLYNGTDMKRLLNAIKIYSTSGIDENKTPVVNELDGSSYVLTDN